MIMAGKGGYQAPVRPAMQSGPGAMSQRTDGGPASKQAVRYISGMPNYGDGADLVDLQSSAPMASTPAPSPAPTSAINAAAQQNQSQVQPVQPIVPLTAPTQRPNEPVTAGAPVGPGPGPEILGTMPTQVGGASAKQTIQALASHPDASPELKRLASILGQ
jgi:hypothetical protein